MTTCEKCGAELAIGDFPFCPHGKYGGGVTADDLPGGIEIKHGAGLCNPDGSPRKYYSKSSIAKAAKAAGLTNYVRHVGTPGSDKSPFTSRWT